MVDTIVEEKECHRIKIVVCDREERADREEENPVGQSGRHDAHMGSI